MGEQELRRGGGEFGHGVGLPGGVNGLGGELGLERGHLVSLLRNYRVGATVRGVSLMAMSGHFGGALTIDSAPGAGTRVRLRIPLGGPVPEAEAP